MDIRANYLYMCASGNVCKMVCAQLGRAQKICAQKIVRKKFVRKWVQINSEAYVLGPRTQSWINKKSNPIFKNFQKG